VTNASKAIQNGDTATPPVRVSGRHFVPRPTKPGIGRPVRGRLLRRRAGAGDRP